MLHLIREADMSRVLRVYESPEQIPQNNIELARSKAHHLARGVVQAPVVALEPDETHVLPRDETRDLLVGRLLRLLVPRGGSRLLQVHRGALALAAVLA